MLLADDHGVVRKGLRFLLAQEGDIEVAGEAEDGRQAVRLAADLNPEVVIMDIAMPLLNGIDAAAQICKTNPKIGVIILSMYSDEEFLIRALSAGAKGYLLKDSAEPDLVRAVRAVSHGKTFFSPAIAHTLLEDYVRDCSRKGCRIHRLADGSRERSASVACRREVKQGKSPPSCFSACTLWKPTGRTSCKSWGSTTPRRS